MHTPQLADNLRRALLQAAIEGKLTEREIGDGHAQELLAVIQSEKAALVKAGRLKKSKGLPEIAEDEKPFAIPENWVWVRLGELAQILNGDRGKNYPGKNFWIDKGKPFINAGSLNNSVLDSDGFNYISEERYSLLRAGFIQKNDFLYCLRGSLGKFSLNRDFNEGVIGSSLCIIRTINAGLIPFIFYYLQTDLASEGIKQVSNGTVQPNLSAENVRSFLFPLPPLAEQARIVAKLDALLAETDALKAQETALVDAQKNFPKMLRASLLQAAIEGKLTERESEDGHAQELLQQIQAEKAAQIQAGRLKKSKGLPEIGEDEKPFAIPENWVWVRLGDYLDVRDGTHNTPKYVSTGVPLITSKNLVDNSLDFSNVKYISFNDAVEINKRSKVDVHDIIFAMIGSIGNPVLVKDDILFCIKNVALFKRIDTFTNMEYIYYCLSYFQEYMKREASGGVQSFVALNYLRNYPIPLPPLAEQARIVAKLDALLAQIELLENLS